MYRRVNVAVARPHTDRPLPGFGLHRAGSVCRVGLPPAWPACSSHPRFHDARRISGAADDAVAPRVRHLTILFLLPARADANG